MEGRANLLNTYMHDIGNLRSHHWKYWCDIYMNCAYDCKYCVYRNGEKMGKISPIFKEISFLKAELENLEKSGIIYLGPKADVYQPMENRFGMTRQVLELFNEYNAPTFIVTRSELIRRDFDVIEAMARQGLIEISITIASAKNQNQLEPNTPTVSQRLSLLYDLKKLGIPVSVHLSPIIPFLDDIEEIKTLMSQISDRGADCIYACMLGMADRYYGVVLNALTNAEAKNRLVDIYSGGNKRLDIFSADQNYINNYMWELSNYSSSKAIPFACVHIPEYDTVERTGHIFRYKLPNVGDMVRHFTRNGKLSISLDDTLSYINNFQAVDKDYTSMVRKFWNEKLLFKNTYFHPLVRDGEIIYMKKDVLDLAVTNMRVGSESDNNKQAAG